MNEYVATEILPARYQGIPGIFVVGIVVAELCLPSRWMTGHGQVIQTDLSLN